MTGDLLKFKSDDGGTVLIEVADATGGSVTRGRRSESTVIDAGATLDRVLGQLGSTVKSVISELRAATDSPDEVELEFAVKISADSNVIIARAGGEANFRIALRWSHGDPRG